MKYVNEMQGPKMTTAIALIFEGKPAGRIIANWSNGQCTASIAIYAGPLCSAGEIDMPLNYSVIGKTTGHGYDKLSAAVFQCFKKANIRPIKLEAGNGETEEEFNEWGYTFFQIL